MRPNKPDAPNSAMTPLFHGGYHWRGIGDPAGYPSSHAS